MLLKMSTHIKTILVNATGTTTGGGLTILQQFLEGILLNDKQNTYFVFCSTDVVNKYNVKNIHIVNNIYKRKWIGRIWWDNYGIGNWIKQNGITPDLILSLQNTGVRLGKRIKQIIYYHQSLPMYNYRWSLIKKNERMLWLYKNIYPIFVKRHIYKNDIIVVQSAWMKTAFHKMLKIDLNSIIVIKPTLKIEIQERSEEKGEKSGAYYNIFYPATNLIFKNHEVIYQALDIIAHERKDIIKNIKFYITLDHNKELDYRIKELEPYIVFLGSVQFEKLLDMYLDMDLLVFPSYLETVGLPLVEAAYFGLPVLASDLPYAREAILGYEGACFVKYNDPRLWAEEIINLYGNRKKYVGYKPCSKDSWNDLFQLINDQLIKKE